MTDDQQYTVDAARRAAERDELNEWVAEFLASPGSDNAELGKMLTEPPRIWIGPVQLRLNQLNRLVGPPGDPVLRAVDDDDYWRDDVFEMEERIEDEDWEPPPVVVTYRDDQLVLEDGNHRVESLRRAGEREAWAIINFDSVEARDQFIEAAPSQP